jgi:hypothetical protein
MSKRGGTNTSSTSPHGRGGRHGRAHAECPGLITGRGNHASLGGVANRHRSATQIRVVALFDGA